MIKLWTINRVLRWTGLRLFVTVDHEFIIPTKIGFKWCGLPGTERWRHWEGDRRVEALGAKP